jgi:hypothetical protein
MSLVRVVSQNGDSDDNKCQDGKAVTDHQDANDIQHFFTAQYHQDRYYDDGGGNRYHSDLLSLLTIDTENALPRCVVSPRVFNASAMA